MPDVDSSLEAQPYCALVLRIVNNNTIYTVHQGNKLPQRHACSSSPTFKFTKTLAQSPPLFLLNQYLWLCWPPVGSMHRHSGRLAKGKGKQVASPTPTLSSSDNDNSVTDQPPPAKKCLQIQSPEWVKKMALVKVSKAGSSSKGLAGFAALVNNAKLSAARTEMNQGLHSGSSSSRPRSASAKSKAKIVWILVLLTC